jgi:hypothetical protein
MLDRTQREQALAAMHEYLNAPAPADGLTPTAVQSQRDDERRRLISEMLKPLLDGYLQGLVPLAEFKSKVDGINKREGKWGFKGIKGQMFFNMLVNTAADVSECDQELKAALAMPASNEIARSRLRSFVSYVKRVGDEYLEKGGTKHGRPKVGSAPFFVSYFWQLHDWKVWPVYYTNSAQVMESMNLWRPTDDMAENYVQFKQIHEELAELFTRESGRPFDLYEVEHVFWLQGGNPYIGSDSTDSERPTTATTASITKPALIPVATSDKKLPDSYVPPIVAVLPDMARNDPMLADAAKASGTSLERAFEKCVNAAFTILGYETQLLGQGQGRVPDGRATSADDGYAILWDAKVRTSGYSIGTDDRTIREYITTQSREMKRRRSFRNVYYMIVSSGFTDDGDDLIRMLKMDTDVNEVILLNVDALVSMVDVRLRDPQQVSLGPDGLQRLFTSSGILAADDVRELLG